MPDKKRCKYLSNWMDKLNEDDVNFIMWRLADEYQAKLNNELDSQRIDTVEKFYAADCQKRIAEGLRMLHEILGFGW